MKRSDAVVKLANILLREFPDLYEHQSSHGRKVDSSLLLKLIEDELNLTPPEYRAHLRTGKPHSGITRDYTYLRKWEPENE